MARPQIVTKTPTFVPTALILGTLDAQSFIQPISLRLFALDDRLCIDVVETLCCVDLYIQYLGVGSHNFP